MQTRKRLAPWLVLLGFGLVLLAGWLNRYALMDWVRLRNYEPPARIAELAENAQLTPKGKNLFYANHPELNDKVSFNQNCNFDEESIVLGCYASTRRIYLFDVTDERLTGVEEVTAAHEMLHAAYERLSGSKREEIDRLTNDTYSKTSNPRLKETIAAYEKRDPSVIPNELHSILATEVAGLPPELEQYYQQYFKDRSVLVAYSEKYEAAFQERKDMVASYDRQLQSLKQQIESSETALLAQERAIKSERERLDELLAANRTQESNAAVPGYNAQVRNFNSSLNQLRSLTTRYNDLVEQRNAVALEENELVEAIDSRLDTLSTE